MIYWDGLWIFLYALFIPVWLVITEYVQYLFLGEKNETFVVKFSPNPTDYLFTIIVAGTYIFVGLTLPPNLPLSAGTFGFWAVILIIIDFMFGFFHYLTHTVPSLRKLHLLHHEYRKEDLNTLANYYADLIDTLLMNISNIVLSFASVWFVQNPVVIKEIFTTAMSTHHKYPTHQLTFFYFFEFELLDMLLGGVRLANYHNAHHNLVDENFSLVGIVNDKQFIDFTKTLFTAGKKFFPQLLK
jgi:sterol desaturase/sphingolipid hydroxylase (fatty acid hydroxylase superfamily)